MCGCEPSFVCAKCRTRHLTDMVLEAAVPQPRTPAEDRYEQTNEYMATVILPALKP